MEICEEECQDSLFPKRLELHFASPECGIVIKTDKAGSPIEGGEAIIGKNIP